MLAYSLYSEPVVSDTSVSVSAWSCEAGPVAKAFHRVVLAVLANGVFPVLVNPRVYRSVGIHPLRGFLAAFFSDQYVRNTKFMAEPMARGSSTPPGWPTAA